MSGSNVKVTLKESKVVQKTTVLVYISCPTLEIKGLECVRERVREAKPTLILISFTTKTGVFNKCGTKSEEGHRGNQPITVVLISETSM